MNKKDQKNIKKLPIIKTRSQLSAVLDGLQEQDFGYISDYKLHDNKVNHIINTANKFNIDDRKFRSELNKLVYDVDSYDEIKKIVINYFKRYAPDDKIKELLNHFYLKPEAFARVPTHGYTDKNEIISWYRFRKKYGIKDEPNFGYEVRVYNLDKNILKINGFKEYSPYGRSKHDFIQLYKLIFNEEPNEIHSKMGGWQDMGKIKIKVYLNGNMDIKGDLKRFKEYLYKSIRKSDCIIIYNGKKEIIEHKKT